MKQLIQNYRSGELKLMEVPAPHLRTGGVLVRNVYSLISAGTERGQIDFGKKSLLAKARSRPDLVRKVLDKARTEGLASTFQKAMDRLDQPLTLGYSCAGVIAGVGEGVRDLAVGQEVACAGLGFASHAEMVYVPRNLCVPLPDGLDLDQAAYVTLGAIALEGLRVADVRLGEKVVVIGLGLLGLLTVQLLKAAGCRVFGIDFEADKLALARELGAEGACSRHEANLGPQVQKFTQGRGADAILITAATSSSDPLELAGELARDRAVVTLVGNTGTQVPRKAFYEKALQLRLSRSYGPGRYDRLYEEKGQDYPIGYVRWTENRNMAAFLDLVAENKVDVKRLTTHTFEISEALAAYDLIQGRRQEPYIGILLKYPEEVALPRQAWTRPQAGEASPGNAAVRIGVIGAGAFANSVLLPALSKVRAHLRGIASQGGVSARKSANQYGFQYLAADAQEILSDPEIEAVAILTPPQSHADLVVQALEHGKHVFVEKPLAVDEDQLGRVLQAYRGAGDSLVLMVGFNRRFSPHGAALQQFFAGHAEPLMMVYRVNASRLETGNWQLDPEQGGGRLIGECGHFVDLMSFICGERPQEVFVAATGIEEAVLTIRFAGGSIGTLVYVVSGSPAFAKERLEVFGDGAVGVLDDFRRLDLVRGGNRKRLKARWRQDKGHAEEMRAFLEAIRGHHVPYSLETAILATLTTIRAAHGRVTGVPQPVHLGMLG